MAESVAALPSTSNNFPLSSSTTSQPNVLSASTSSKVIPGTQSTSSAAPPLVTPPELESTLAMLSSHRTVLGYLLLTRPSPSSTSATSSLPSHSFASVRIIRSSGVVFEGESGKRYAGAIGRIVDTVTRGLADVVGEDGGDADEVRFMRIRTKRHELMISPDERYLLAVLHDPST